MLTALSVRDIVLIDRLDISVGTGLTALTGETGAGKSILLDALGLAVGGKADKGLVRHGAEEGAAVAAFEPGPDHAVWAHLDAHGVPHEDGAVILRRVQRADGRARAFVNDQPVSLGVLRAVGELLVEVHGQHDGHGFLKAATHRAVLDAYAGFDAAPLSEACAAAREAEGALSAHRAAMARAAEDAEYLRHATAEFDRLDPQAGEEADLAELRAAMMAAEKSTADVTEAAGALDAEGTAEKLARAARALERAQGRLGEAEGAARDLLGAAAAKMDAALAAFDEAAGAVAALEDALTVDADALEAAEARLFALRALARKHGVAPDDLPTVRERIAGNLAAIEDGEAREKALQKAFDAARAAYVSEARKLTKARLAAAGELENAVAGELAPLKLDRARFAIALKTDESRIASEGFENVEFQISTNPGAPLGPLSKIASGGELARFVLALKASLAAKEGKTVVIFDEVDAGVGGAVADAVGERLARLAKDEQVLVVTHSPQVAARADGHWKIEKAGKAEVKTSVRRLSADERVEEIARMLAGAKVTDAARDAAKALLAPEKPKKAKRKNAA